MWSDLEMLIMSLCCIGLGFTIGVDFKAAQVKRTKNRMNKKFGLQFGSPDIGVNDLYPKIDLRSRDAIYIDTDSIKTLH